MAKAMWNGQVLAESEKTETVEGNIYFPEESVNRQFLRASSTTSSCPWKGQARYYTLIVDGQENPDAAWYYYTDNEPSKGYDYYRIRQVDIDGRSSWSPTIKILSQKSTVAFRVQSNPAGDELTLVNNNNQPIQRVWVLDVSGKKIIDQAPFSSNTIININIRPLRPGYYFLNVSTGSDNTILRFLKR